MKKLFVLFMAFILTLALVGCESLGDEELLERMRDLGSPTTEYLERRIDELGEELEDEIPLNYYSKNEVDQIIQSEIDELELIIDNLEEIIFENQRRLDEMQQPCYLLELIGDYQKALDDGFTFTIIDGVMYEYKDGIATGDSWIEEDIIADYCNIYD